MIAPSAALLFAALCTFLAGFHLALAGGAPLGHLTMGGQWPGRLPRRARLLSVVQIGIVAAMAVVVLARAGVIGLAAPGWAFWTVIALCGLTLAANAASRSRPERRLGVPVALLLLLSGLVAGLA